MSDIVERLRSYAKDQGGWHNIDETCEQAADEIERLRAQVASLLETITHYTCDCDPHDCAVPDGYYTCGSIARAALESK